MMLLRLTLLITLCFCLAQAVLSGKELKRREAGFDSYGPPPRPAPQYGPPPQQQQQQQHHHIPHREYGVPQQIPFREYGPPALKYGPPKLNFLGGGGHGGGGHGGGGHGGGGGGGGLYEQIKSHFGVPKPFYGPPHIQHKPAHEYGPPPPKPVYGPPAPQYGPPPPQAQYGPPPQQNYGPPPPLKLQHRPAPQYGPPPPHHHKPHFPQPLPAPHPAQLFKPAHQPATSYGPPASGPLNLPPKPVYDTPPNYGPPPLPVNLPGPQPANFNRAPETTIILTGGGGGQQLPTGPGGPAPFKQVQIQIDASGHTHSVSGSQAPFHTACDGWKPIPAPIGAYIEQNHIETQGGYSNVDQGQHSHGQSFGTQYNVGGDIGIGSTGSGGGGGGGSIVDGLSDEQLVAVALQGEAGNLITGPGGDAHLNNNNIDSDALQISVGAIDDSYSKPPSDSFAPGSVHAQKYQTIGNVGPNYGPPPPPPQFAALTSSHGQSQSQSHSQSHSNVNIQYGPPPSGNPPPFARPGAGHPNKPVAYRPPVPSGLLESIGATVQHLDQFGVKPAQQPPTYIPPAAHEIALSGPPTAPQAIYGTPLNQQQQAPPPQQIIVQQQLPQPQPGPSFIHQKPGQLQQYGPPGPLPQPQPNYLPPGPPPQQQQQQQQYLPPRPPPNVHHQQQQQQQHHHSENSFSSSQYTQQFVHSQGLPLSQQAPRFNQLPQPQQQQQHQPQSYPQQQTVVVHDCGHGPNLVSSNGYQVQQQQQQQQQQYQQQQQFGSISASSPGAYNAIAQSIPVAEQHTQFVTGPSDSYGPPPSGNEIDFDHSGYASQKSSVAALPDGTDPQQLPGLDGLNVISAQKSQSIQLNSDQPAQNFQVQFGSSLNNVGAGGNPNHNAAQGEAVANHEEILSQGLLQSILTAIEQPQSSSSSLPQNHKAQSRSDEPHHEDQKEHEQQLNDDDADEGVEEQQQHASNRVEVRVLPEADANEKSDEQIEPIVAAEVEEVEDAKH